MREPLELTDATLDSVLMGTKPVLILFTTGNGLRGDFKAAFDKAVDDAANEHIVFARIDPDRNPKAAQRFNAGDKPVLIGVYCGDEIARRARPWGTDLPLALEVIQKAYNENTPPPAVPNPDEEKPKTMVVIDKPVHVTDATFEQEVLNSNLPVLVDFGQRGADPCRAVAPALEKLAGEFAGQIKIAKVNTDENPGLSQAFQIRSIPNLMIVKNRTMIFNQPGALPEPVLRDLIKQAIAVEVPQPAPQVIEGKPAPKKP